MWDTTDLEGRGLGRDKDALVKHAGSNDCIAAKDTQVLLAGVCRVVAEDARIAAMSWCTWENLSCRETEENATGSFKRSWPEDCFSLN
jgi:hypothetical protein